MTTDQVPEVSVREPLAALRYGLIPVHGYDIVVATVTAMLDGVHGNGARARVLQPGEPIPYGALPVLVAPSTVFGALAVERMVRAWSPGVPRPWLVLVADVPASAVPAARYRLRALSDRLAGTAHVPYLPVLRAVEAPEDALKNADVARAAAKLCRQMEGTK
ncbi:hypothetical protein KV557_24890 [Kitasatospora aureofaciens]|uniref:hypothetical protein n=1 Tax=Kitasatospora aureofaciens TaxID=1894 RepID=UPI001C46B5B0|nr:hypothetical protein [Kitasatospora aureofaciens]MBV6700303.1 hypothetical protein [Kitasatospora aureofaciens]